MLDSWETNVKKHGKRVDFQPCFFQLAFFEDAIPKHLPL